MLLNVTVAPSTTVVPGVAEIDAIGTVVVLTVSVMVLPLAVLVVAQVALLVNITVTWSPSAGVVFT